LADEMFFETFNFNFETFMVEMKCLPSSGLSNESLLPGLF